VAKIKITAHKTQKKNSENKEPRSQDPRTKEISIKKFQRPPKFGGL